MPDLTNIDKILADLPVVQQIALRPLARNPLLSVVLEQAAALNEIAGWAGAAKTAADDEAPPSAAPLDLPVNVASSGVVRPAANVVKPVPTKNGTGG